MDVTQRSSSVGSLRRLKKGGLKKRKVPEEWKGAALFEKKLQATAADKENLLNTENSKHKKHKKQQPSGATARAPLSPRPTNAGRSTSAAVAMAKIASINAQAAARPSLTPASEVGAANGPKAICSSTWKSPAKLVATHPTSGTPSSLSALTSSADISVGTKEEASERTSTVENIRRCSTAMVDSEATLEARLKLSDRMALEAEKLHLETQIQAERASITAKEMSLKSEKDEAQSRAEELQFTLQNLAQQMKELTDSKQSQEKELRRQVRDASAVRMEMQQLRQLSDTLKREVDQLRQQVQVDKAEKLEVEKELEHQKQLNRRLSQRLSGRFSSTCADTDDDLADLLCEASGETEKTANTGNTVSLASPAKAAHPSHPNPQTPRALLGVSPLPRSASRPLPQEGEGDRRSSFIKVPTVTPSKAHAPAIYNEPKNKAKQQEYAQLLEQQIAERRQIQRQEHAFQRAPTDDYFPFGRPGSGAPVRDENSNVVANVTFSRSQRPVPVDHPAGPLFAQRSVSQEMFAARKKHP